MHVHEHTHTDPWKVYGPKSGTVLIVSLFSLLQGPKEELTCRGHRSSGKSSFRDTSLATELHGLQMPHSSLFMINWLRFLGYTWWFSEAITGSMLNSDFWQCSVGTFGTRSWTGIGTHVPYPCEISSAPRLSHKKCSKIKILTYYGLYKEQARKQWQGWQTLGGEERGRDSRMMRVTRI